MAKRYVGIKLSVCGEPTEQNYLDTIELLQEDLRLRFGYDERAKLQAEIAHLQHRLELAACVVSLVEENCLPDEDKMLAAVAKFRGVSKA